MTHRRTLKDRYSHRKVGQRAPEWLLERLHRFHPNARLLWDRRFRRWVVVDIKLKPASVVLSLDPGEQPAIKNVLRPLDRMKANWRKWSRTRSGVAQWLASIEAKNDAIGAAIDKDASESYREGSNMIWDKLGIHKVVIPKPTG